MGSSGRRPPPKLAARGELTWGFNLNEPDPRGQFNGTVAAGQVATEGSWWRHADVGPGSRFNAATVIGADFPTVALREAHWDPTTASVTDIPLGAMASFLNLMPRLRRARTRCSGG